ncbi:hypothetical protein QQF64_020405 [Cirrhinus molitorella]|uniref:THUMP domain-containing protein n=1 Tax=Cirrhinus molitorella TaxID=172907 RepID=A0ABR3LAJ9_9TELE
MLAKNESRTIDGTALMAAIKSLEVGIHQKFDAHAAEFRQEIVSLRIPEGTEGPQPTKFVAKAVQEIFTLDEPPLLARAHCTLAARPPEDQKPPAFVICFHRFDVKEDILRKAIQAKQLKFKDKNVHVFPDFPPEIAKKRAAYYEVKQVLRARSEVKYGLRGLIGFRITCNNAEHKFETPAEAMTFVKQQECLLTVCGPCHWTVSLVVQSTFGR